MEDERRGRPERRRERADIAVERRVHRDRRGQELQLTSGAAISLLFQRLRTILGSIYGAGDEVDARLLAAHDVIRALEERIAELEWRLAEVEPEAEREPETERDSEK